MLTASIVLYNSDFHWIARSIENFKASRHAGRLFLIDNAPGDERFLQWKNDEQIIYIPNEKNVGFGKAHNMAMRRSLENSKYHLIINPDVQYEPAVLDKVVGYMESNQDVCLLMPKILDAQGQYQRMCKLLPTPLVFFGRRFLGNAFKRTSVNKQFEMQGMDQEAVTEVPFLSGCFLFFRNSTLKKTGLFDENIFLFCEDIDINRRMWDFGKTVYYPEASVHHFHERKSFKNLRMFRYYLKSTVYYFNKWGWFWDRERKRINAEASNKMKTCL